MTDRREEQVIARTILGFFREQLAVDVASADTDLIEIGVLDSLVDLVMHIEEEFHISVTLEDLEIENFTTVAKMVRYVAARTAAGPSPPHDDATAVVADAAPKLVEIVSRHPQ